MWVRGKSLRAAMLRLSVPRAPPAAARRLSTGTYPAQFANASPSLYESIMQIYTENKVISHYSATMISIVVLQRAADHFFDLRPVFAPLRKLLVPPNESSRGVRAEEDMDVDAPATASGLTLLRADSTEVTALSEEVKPEEIATEIDPAMPVEAAPMVEALAEAKRVVAEQAAWWSNLDLVGKVWAQWIDSKLAQGMQLLRHIARLPQFLLRLTMQ